LVSFSPLRWNTCAIGSNLVISNRGHSVKRPLLPVTDTGMVVRSTSGNFVTGPR
jgi:hypothetical protein